MSAYLTIGKPDARGVSLVSFRGAGPIGKVRKLGALRGYPARYWPMTMDEQHMGSALHTRKEAAQFIERERYGWDPNTPIA